MHLHNQELFPLNLSWKDIRKQPIHFVFWTDNGIGSVEKKGFTAGATFFSVVCKDGLGFCTGIAAGAWSYTTGGIRLCNIYLLLLLKIK